MKTFYALIFLFFGIQAFSQEALNVSTSVTDDYLIVKYDLKGKADILYEVTLHFLDDKNEKIVPRSLNGDVGKVEAGSAKTIVWDVYKDVDGIQGSLIPIVTVKQGTQKSADTKKQPTPMPQAPGKIIDVLTKQVAKNSKRERKPVRIGIRLGSGKSNVNTEQREFFFTSERSYIVGPYLRWNLSRKFYLQPEVLYHQSRYNELLNAEEKLVHKNDQIRGQLMAGLAPIGLGLHFNFGVYYGYVFQGLEYSDLDIVSQTQTINDIKPANADRFPFDENDAGFLIGGSLSLGQGSLVLGVIHSRGFDNFVQADYFIGESVISGQSLVNKSTHFFIQKGF